MPSRRKFIQQATLTGTAALLAPSLKIFAASGNNDWHVPAALQHEMYQAAIAIAKKKVRGGESEPVFKKPFLDAAFNGNVFLWDTCFYCLLCQISPG